MEKMMKKNKKPFVTENVIKPRQLIHIERKAPKMAQEIFNVLLKRAWPEMERGKTYSMPLKDLQYYVPSAKNATHVRKLLKTLDIRIEYNIFNKVRATSGYFVLLPEAKLIIEKGVGRIEYSFTNTMIEIFSARSMYAKINLLIQKQFKGSKYGLDLYELCFDYRKIKTTPFFPVDELRKYFGVENQKTYDSFKYFNKFIIKKGTQDINKYTDLTISSETRKEDRTITHIRFHINEKKDFRLALPAFEDLSAPERRNSAEEREAAFQETTDDLDLGGELRKLGVSAAGVKETFAEYSIEQIKEAIQVCREAEEKPKGIVNPTAFIKNALKDGYQSDATIEKRKKQAADEKRRIETEAREAERRRIEEARRQQEERYANSTDEEKFEYVIEHSSNIQEEYEALTPENQKKLRKYSQTVFASFDRFESTYLHILREAKDLREKQR